jgi:phage/plasmid-like protein (TIGR03299 family)
MAHNIHFNQQTGKHSFFSVKEKAWHGLGTIVQDYLTSAQAIQFAGLNYDVVKQDLYTTAYNADAQAMDVTKRVKTHFATIRPDTGDVLGVVGQDYEIVQNRNAFSFFDSIVGGDGIMYETAGALGKGERIFITAKLPDYIKVGSDDMIEKYIFLTTSHDGTGSIIAAFTPTRIVCNNTLTLAMGNMSHSIKIRHTANAKERLEQAHKVMGLSNTLSVELETLFNKWSKVRITDPQLKKLIQQALAPNKEVLTNLEMGKDDELSTQFKNTVESAYAYALANPSQQLDTTKGTVFGAYNAITGYFQNVREYKNSENKLKSILYGGTAQQRSQTAFKLCLDLAKN